VRPKPEQFLPIVKSALRAIFAELLDADAEAAEAEGGRNPLVEPLSAALGRADLAATVAALRALLANSIEQPGVVAAAALRADAAPRLDQAACLRHLQAMHNFTASELVRQYPLLELPTAAFDSAAPMQCLDTLTSLANGSLATRPLYYFMGVHSAVTHADVAGFLEPIVALAGKLAAEDAREKKNMPPGNDLFQRRVLTVFFDGESSVARGLSGEVLTLP
jgi:hypothetical protein